MDYTFLLGSIENLLGKSHKRARANHAFHCPFCNHRKPKLEINMATNEKGHNPWECWVCQTKGRTIRSLLKQLNTPKDQAALILKYLPKGSEIEYTSILRSTLPKIITSFDIKSICDAPCGDFNWMKEVDLSKIDYVGADIVDELIYKNIRKYKHRKNLKFKVLNLISDTLPKTDILILRDCLVHLSNKDIYSAIKNIKSSGSKYLLSTTFIDHQLNIDIVTGDWRPLNLQKHPFNFPSPILIINENCTEANGEYSDKSLALWDINKIELP